MFAILRVFGAHTENILSNLGSYNCDVDRMWNNTVSQKKQDTKLLAITSVTISLADSAVNLQQKYVKIFHNGLNTSLHYLVKYESHKNGVNLKYVM